MKNNVITDRITAITNVRIFDGERVFNDTTVVINGAHIQTVGGVVPAGATVIDTEAYRGTAVSHLYSCASVRAHRPWPDCSRGSS